MNYFINIFKHLRVVFTHKKEVLRLSIIAGIPIRGLLHDLSKFSPIEFFESVRYCNGKESPIKVCKRQTGKSLAWLHHKAHNKHHWEYWVDDLTHGGKGVCMPYKYALEMAIDIISANRTYNKDNWEPSMLDEYWKANRKSLMIHPQTLKFLDLVFDDYIQYGDLSLKKEHTKRKYKNIMNINKEKFHLRKSKYISVPRKYHTL